MRLSARGVLRGIAGAIGLLALLTSAAIAQEDGAEIAPITQFPTEETESDQVRSPVLTIDTDRLFGESRFGQRILSDLGQATEALATENRRIEAELKEEERSLTERRPDMDVETFRDEADAFDARVQRIRQEQDAKERALQDRLADGQESFLARATPILGRLMLDRGAVVILDRRTVFLGVGIVDVTDDAIDAIDAEIGEGADIEVPAPN